MAYNNNWSITEIAGISDLRDSYQWQGNKRLWDWILLRRIDDYSSTNAGRYGTVIKNTTPSNDTLPYLVSDTAVQKSSHIYGGGIRYYAIPGFLANGQNIIAIGNVYSAALSTESAYNHKTMTWGDATKTPSNIKNWGYSDWYPTIINGAESFSEPVQALPVSKMLSADKNRILYESAHSPSLLITYGSSQQFLYEASYEHSMPTIKTEFKRTNVTWTAKNWTNRAIQYWTLTTTATGTASVNFKLEKIIGGVNRIPLKTFKTVDNRYVTNSASEIISFSAIGSDHFPLVFTCDEFVLEPGTYYYKLNNTSNATIRLMRLAGGSGTVFTDTWQTLTLIVATAYKATITITESGNYTLTPMLMKRPLSQSGTTPTNGWDDITFGSTRNTNYIKNSLFYEININYSSSATNTTQYTTDNNILYNWVYWNGNTLGITGDGFSGGYIAWSINRVNNINLNIKRLIPWFVSKQSQSLTPSIGDSYQWNHTMDSYTVRYMNQTRTVTSSSLYLSRTFPLNFFYRSNFKPTFTLDNSVIGSGYQSAPMQPSLINSKTELSALNYTGNGEYIWTFTETNFSITRGDAPKCLIGFDKEPLIYFVRVEYRDYSESGAPLKYGYRPYIGEEVISTSTYVNSTLPITFYSYDQQQTINFQVPSGTGTTTATFNGHTISWHGPDVAIYGGLITTDTWDNTCSLHPVYYTRSTSSGVVVTSPLTEGSELILGEVKDSGLTYHTFTLKTRCTSIRQTKNVTTDDGQYKLAYTWFEGALTLKSLTPVGGGAAYTLTTVQNLRFYEN